MVWWKPVRHFLLKLAEFTVFIRFYDPPFPFHHLVLVYLSSLFCCFSHLGTLNYNQSVLSQFPTYQMLSDLVLLVSPIWISGFFSPEFATNHPENEGLSTSVCHETFLTCIDNILS